MTRIPSTLPLQLADSPAPVAQMPPGQASAAQRFAGLLARADVDMRGRTAVPAEQVLEVLVARLAAQSAGVSRRR